MWYILYFDSFELLWSKSCQKENQTKVLDPHASPIFLATFKNGMFPP